MTDDIEFLLILSKTVINLLLLSGGAIVIAVLAIVLLNLMGRPRT